MKAVSQVLVAEFYRRNYLFFLLIVVLLVFVFRPPTLLFSPIFIEPMLENNTFFCVVMGLILLYYLKCWYETWQHLHLPVNSFLYILSVLPPAKLQLTLLRQVLQILAPGMLYAFTIAAYSAYHQTWHIGPILLGHFLFLFVMSTHLRLNVYRANEIVIHSGIQAWVENRFQRSFAFIALQTLLNHHRVGLLLMKGLIWLLMLITLVSHAQDSFSPKALYLILLSLAGLQLLLPYWLRSSEDAMIFGLRNLPISWPKRLLSYCVTGIVLFLPELILWIAGSSADIHTAVIEGGSYCLMALGFFLLGVSLMYYQAWKIIHFIRLGCLIYLLFFLAILFQIPIWIPIILALGMSMMIFGEEFYKWNGFHQD